MNDNDLIRRGDALAAIGELGKQFMEGGSPTGAKLFELAYDRLAALPAVLPGVKALVWENFDAWTYWARCPVGTYHVEERNGWWQVELRFGGLVHSVAVTGDTLPDDLETAKAAAQADYDARILAALEPVAAPDADAICDTHAQNAKRLIEYDWQEWAAQDVEDAAAIVRAFLTLITEKPHDRA